MYILEWKVCVSFHSSNLLQCQKSRTCSSWKWKANISWQYITIAQNHVHTSTSWEWKVRVSFHSSNSLQCPKIAYMYILEVESSRFFPFLQYITMPKNCIHVYSVSGKLTFLSIPQYITMPKNRMHVHSGSGKLTFLYIPHDITMPQNHMYILGMES